MFAKSQNSVEIVENGRSVEPETQTAIPENKKSPKISDPDFEEPATALRHRLASIVVVLLFVAFSILLRELLWERDLPYYSIDENDVVEPSLAFLLGDMDPHWFKYGPLFSYLLSAAFKIFQWILFAAGWEPAEFLHAAFFNQQMFYIFGRAFHSLVIFGIAAAMYAFARRFFGKPASIAALFFGMAPLLDLNTEFTIRVDTLQGLLSILAIYAISKTIDNPQSNCSRILAGIAAGLNIASKPLPGLLLLPALFLGHYWSSLHSSGTTVPRTLPARLIATLSNKGLWLTLSALAVAAIAANPYSAIRFPSFLTEQIGVFFNKADQGGVLSGYDIRWLIDIWGLPLVCACAASLFIVFSRTARPMKLLACYVLTFFGVFALFKVRTYWYNAMLPAALLLCAEGVGKIAESFRLRVALPPALMAGTLALLLTLPPWVESIGQARSAWVPAPQVQRRADYAAQEWIEANIPSGSSILAVGYYAVELPRLLADSPASQAVWGEYFMYGRDENKPWVNAFLHAYSRERASGRPVYKIVNIRVSYSANPSYPSMVPLFDENLPELVKKQGLGYLVTGSKVGFRGKWEDRGRMTLLKRFGPDLGYTGEVKIFALRAAP